MNKISEFHATVYTLQPDIIGVTKSWATENILNSELELAGYILFRHDRPVKKRGGGVLLYIKSILQPVRISLRQTTLSIYGAV